MQRTEANILCRSVLFDSDMLNMRQSPYVALFYTQGTVQAMYEDQWNSATILRTHLEDPILDSCDCKDGTVLHLVFDRAVNQVILKEEDRRFLVQEDGLGNDEAWQTFAGELGAVDDTLKLGTNNCDNQDQGILSKYEPI